MNDKLLKETNRLLKVVIGLLVRRDGDKKLTLRYQIVILRDFGLSTNEIAQIIGRTGNYVNKELFELRKINK